MPFKRPPRDFSCIAQCAPVKIWELPVYLLCREFFCSLMLPLRLREHQRMNANGNWHRMIYFPETIIQKDTIPVMVMLYNCCTMHNNTHSVHNRLLKPWWGRLLCPQSSCLVFPPPLSGLNWCSLSPLGGPGPPTPKVASPFPGSAHTPSPGFRTVNIKINGAIEKIKNRQRMFT